MLQFVLFIDKVLNATTDDTMVFLVAHNGHRFDVRFLIRYMQRFNYHTHHIWKRYALPLIAFTSLLLLRIVITMRYETGAQSNMKLQLPFHV